MKPLIEEIDAFIDRVKHGWTSQEKARTLAAIIVALKPEVTVEIGVYAGRSAISMAMAHRYINHGKVIGIDPYSKEAATEGYEGDHKKWWDENVNLDHIHALFIDTVKHYGLDKHITLIRAKSDDATPPDSIGLFHCDGSHTDQAVRDVERYASKVPVGGVVVMDDIHWPGGGVLRAVTALEQMGFVKLYDLDGGAVFQRKSQ